MSLDITISPSQGMVTIDEFKRFHANAIKAYDCVSRLLCSLTKI